MYSESPSISLVRYADDMQQPQPAQGYHSSESATSCSICIVLVITLSIVSTSVQPSLLAHNCWMKCEQMRYQFDRQCILGDSVAPIIK